MMIYELPPKKEYDFLRKNYGGFFIHRIDTEGRYLIKPFPRILKIVEELGGIKINED